LYCDAHVVSLRPLARDLASAATTPAYSWITPDTCADGYDTPRWYRKGGLTFITFEESGNDQNAAACCGEKDSLGYRDPSHPNTNEPGLFGPAAAGRRGRALALHRAGHREQREI